MSADQQLMMLCQLSAPIQSADDLLFRLNNMDSDSINAEQVAESKDVGRGSSAFTGHVDSHSAPTEAQMVELLQSSAKDVSASEIVSTRKRLSKAEFGKSSIPLDSAASPTLPTLKVSFTVYCLDIMSFIHAFIHLSLAPPPPPAPGARLCTLRCSSTLSGQSCFCLSLWYLKANLQYTILCIPDCISGCDLA